MYFFVQGSRTRAFHDATPCMTGSGTILFLLKGRLASPNFHISFIENPVDEYMMPPFYNLKEVS